MILLAHIAFSTAASKTFKFSWPWAFVFGFISHHVLDFIPHTDAACVWPKKMERKGIIPKPAMIFIIIDIASCLIFFFWSWLFLKMNFVVLFWASFGAVLPDLIITGFTHFYRKALKWKWMLQYDKLHMTLFAHLGIPENWILGTFTTILIIGVSFWLLLK